MTTYAYITDNKVTKTGSLPKQYEGAWTENLTPAQLKGRGVLPYSETLDAINSRTQKHAAVVYTITTDNVTGHRAAIAKTAQELQTDYDTALASLRLKRNALLDESQWVVGNDSPISTEKQVEWKIQRQALRDLPNEIGATHPDDVVFPTQPTV